MMLSVVAGHIANFPFGEVFYYYQVAGFFLLSGYFFHYDKYADRFSKFLKSRSKLICQYLIYSAIIISTHNLLTEFGYNLQITFITHLLIMSQHLYGL